MINKLKNMIKRCLVSKPGNDTGQFPIAQVTYLGKTGNSEEIYPYGMGAVAPENSLGLVFSVNGDEGNRSHIATNSDLRLKNLVPGESYFGNLVSGSVMIFSENGDWNVTINNDGNLTCEGNLNITVNGDANVTASNNVDVNASSVNINAGTTTTSGDTNLGGGGAGIARIGDVVSDINFPFSPIGTITTGSGTNTAS